MIETVTNVITIVAIVICVIGLIIVFTMKIEPEGYPQQPKRNPKPLKSMKKHH